MKTNCSRGHELTANNTITDRDGYIRCKTCKSMTRSANMTEVRRIARADAPRSLSAMLLGDPPKGYSALDRRQST